MNERRIDVDQIFVVCRINDLTRIKMEYQKMVDEKNKNNVGIQTILTLIDCLDYSIKKLEDFYKENWGE